MKILYHHRTQGTRVEGVHIREIVKALEIQGHEVIVVSPPGIDPLMDNVKTTSDKPLVSRILSFLSSHAPQIFFEFMEIFYNFAAYRNISAVLKGEKIDMIYERYAFFGIAGVLASRKYKVPLILEVNEVSDIERQRGQVLKSLTKKFEKYIFTKAQGIITVSSWLKKTISGMGIDHDRIRMVPNAVDLKSFDPQISGADVREKYGLNDSIVLGFVGSFSTWDRLDFLIDVFADMLKTSNNLKLMLIGDGYNKDSLIQYALKKGLNDTVVFTGRVLRRDIAAYLAAVDIFVIPHSNPFGSPVVMFEYMAMAKPVAGPSLMPVLDVIEDKVNGLIFETGNKESLIAALSLFINDKQLRENIGNTARKSVEEKHTWGGNAGVIIDLVKRSQQSL